MSLTFGFYNSQNGDRLYNADQMSSLFDGIIKDGIFKPVGDKLMVTKGSGMTVNVGTGRAWFNQTWTYNDSTLPITISEAEVALNRIDTVVVDVNKLTRTNSIIVVKGTPATNPVAPTLINDANGQHYQYPLCNIRVDAGVTSIAQNKITNRVGVDTPFATSDTNDADLDTRLAIDGSSTMAGDLNMGGHKISNSMDCSDLIWKNNTPNDVNGFTQQSISMNMKAYDFIIVTCQINKSNSTTISTIIPIKFGARMGICIIPASTIDGTKQSGNLWLKQAHSRAFVVSDTLDSMFFDDCEYIPDPNDYPSGQIVPDYGTDKIWLIPVSVHGIKFVTTK